MRLQLREERAVVQCEEALGLSGRCRVDERGLSAYGKQRDGTLWREPLVRTPPMRTIGRHLADHRALLIVLLAET